MTAGPQEDLRFEVKFVTDEPHLPQVERWIVRHPAGLRRPYAPRRVNNLYFDHPALHAYAQVGAASREKLRWRWYGQVPHAEDSTLEVKRRRNRLGWKLRFPVGPIDLREGPWRERLRGLRRSVPPEARLWMDAFPVPQLINRYDRRYFVSADGRIRLTIDRNHRVFPQHPGVPNLLHRSPAPDTVIVEVKFAQADEEAGNRFVQGLPIRVSRSSKYAVALRGMLL